MIRICEYTPLYDEQLKAVDMMSFLNIKYHPDVLADTVCLAVEDDKLLGVGFLKAGATFLKVDTEELPYYYIHAEFKADENADAESQVIASRFMLEELKGSFTVIQDKYPGKRLILRLWCGAGKSAYLEFLMSLGFRPMRVIPVMVKELEDEEFTSDDSIILPNGEELKIREMNPCDENFAAAYTVTNREAFEVEDSIGELKFMMGGEDTHVFAVMKGERVIAAVTTWVVSEGRAVTENIFCARDCRRMGITGRLLEYTFSFLKAKGYEEASLTVFGDNQPAAQLYFKSGYQLESCILECHYELNYKNAAY